ncbi:MAG: hypothetical protein JWM14_1963 [Chitinophagaceae bacterium]|nr:hypothetical protein [Chitinophagaceae bacterium]
MLERYIQDGLVGAPDVLYKYRSWDDKNHKDILLSKRLYYSKADSFNDPFDINIKISYQSLTEDQLFDMVKKILNENEPHLSEEFLIRDAKRIAKETTKQTLIDREKAQLDLIRNTYGVICLSSNNKSILMWSYYANSHAGFVIGFNTKKLFFKSAGLLGEVHYVDKYSTIILNSGIDVMEHIIPQLVYKSHVWKHEGEYRFIKRKTIDFFEFSSDDVDEIILGANISVKDEQEIISICKSNYPSTKIYKMLLHSTKFQLELHNLL